ncbi:MAG: lycopene cyclase family protein [Corynebacterium provencense]|jgi:lycopene beta-cyclase|uniref:lycopene cyclase family protein n=1 Tax=Corynebacterium provencense TaxID=1737425 RepID=UPI002989DA8F|nr:lycopene cyclase family protein [Corynebacterium provencense]
MTSVHVAVVGLGPAGALVAHRAVARGWTVDGYDPACVIDDGTVALPGWRHTYGFPVRALPAALRESVPFSTVTEQVTAHTPHLHRLHHGPYGIVDVAAARDRLSPGVRLHRTRVTDMSAAALGVDAVIDCRGVVDRPGAVRQVAYGLFLPEDAAARAGLTVGEFMDWRPSPAACSGTSGTAASGPADQAGQPEMRPGRQGTGNSSPHTGTDPSFLYVQDTGTSVLAQETVLATRTPSRTLLPELRVRLLSRLGDAAAQATGTETVHFPTDRRRRPWYLGPDDRGTVTFGAAGGLTHPATGYSVAASAAAADLVLDSIVEGAPVGRMLSASLAHRLRLLGAELIVRADGPTLRRFFDAFFSLPPSLQRGYLTGQGAGAVAAAMVALGCRPRDCLPFLRPLPQALRYTLKPR